RHAVEAREHPARVLLEAHRREFTEAEDPAAGTGHRQLLEVIVGAWLVAEDHRDPGLTDMLLPQGLHDPRTRQRLGQAFRRDAELAEAHRVVADRNAGGRPAPGVGASHAGNGAE